ncbi:hypothetical protein PYW07_015695 [Mythimna separata]|uniref:Ribosomal RNA-processing protein 8 n=1 Tax=Mythimna separata TaxID=271217 RepID=A0AAD8DUM0_MYTSE|nr:hypothetical protein PYW07_015695 [Mythimna separata]
MFKIPAWEDDSPKTGATFLPKAKKKEKTVKTPAPKDNHVKQNNKSVNNNVIVNGQNKASRKRKIENILSKKTKQGTILNTKKKKDEATDNILETQNFDEILLNAKKKKFNEVIEKDDKEDLLFSENTQKKGKKKKAKVSQNGVSISTKTTEETPKHNKKVNQNSVSVNSKSTEGIKKLNNKSNKKVVNNNNDVSNSEVNEEPVNHKKARLKSLLESLRTPINASKTGNKLRDRMMERLKAAQFRYLNEKLYTSSGSEAQQLFQSDPAAFETYHQGYQLQVKKWPVNPLDVIVKKIMKMPKTHTIADLGCGEAALSRRVPHKVRSFDLVATAPGVEACDMARTPLLTASMDVTVYCLALMGTDLTQYLVEANRVLKMGGHLLIAEVESRFDKVEDFAKEVERLGFKLKQLDKSHNVFFFMEFTKIRDPPVKKAKLPALTLKPCLYKRR